MRSGASFRRVLRFALQHIRVFRSPMGAVAEKRNKLHMPVLARSRREILEPWFRVEVSLYVHHASDRQCIEWVQWHQAILFVKNLRIVEVRRDRPRGSQVRLLALVELRRARLPCSERGGVDSRSSRVDQPRLVLCGAQAREDVACVIPIRGAMRLSQKVLDTSPHSFGRRSPTYRPGLSRRPPRLLWS